MASAGRRCEKPSAVCAAKACWTPAGGAGPLSCTASSMSRYLGPSASPRQSRRPGSPLPSKLLRVEQGPAGDDRRPGARCRRARRIVQWVERLRYADAEPLALDLSATCPRRLAAACLVAGDLAEGSLYGLLETTLWAAGHRRHRTPAGGRMPPARAQTPAARPGRGRIRGRPRCLCREQPVEWRRSLVRGRGYVLSASWGVVPRGGHRSTDVSARPRGLSGLGQPPEEGSPLAQPEGTVASMVKTLAVQLWAVVGPNQKS